MRILFMGTPDFAVSSLAALLKHGHEIAGVVTQPDRPKGRGKQLAFSPVKTYALEQGLTVFQPERIADPAEYGKLLELKPDLLVTAAFGQLIPTGLLEAPVYGSVNVHASLLPRWRGGAPIHRAIINGDAKSGVTLMRMVKKLDAGNILAVVETPIENEDTCGTLHDRLSSLGAELLCRTLPRLAALEVEEIVQDEALVTYAPNLTKEDERIDWSKTSRELYNQVRGLNPWPVAFTTWRGEILKIWETRECGSSSALQDQPPGAFTVQSGHVYVKTGDGWLELLSVQPAGKKRMPAIDFANGLRQDAGTGASQLHFV